MRRGSQAVLGIGFVAVALSALLLSGPSDAQVPEQLPVVLPHSHKNYVEKVTDQVSFEMIAIPGGKFLMGSPDTEKGRKSDEGPQHPVEIKPFYMAKFEMQWELYDLYWQKRQDGSKPSENPKDKDADAVSRPTPPYADETFGFGRGDMGALCMTHHAIMEFSRWLSAKTGKLYRLPTEAEWEWAARAGTTTAYSFGDDPKKLDAYGWYVDNSDDMPHKVGQKKPNPWGLYDMHGNLSEWCFDHYKKDYYSDLPKDKLSISPVNIPSAARYPYVVRGGSWIDPPEACRSAARGRSEKDWLRRDPQRPQSIWWMTDADFVGFRLICPLEEQENLKGYKSKVTRESN